MRQHNSHGLYYSLPRGLPKKPEGSPTLFIHGFAGSQAHWDSLLPHLSNAIYPILVDLPGHGKSLGTMPDNIDNLIDLLLKFLVELNLEDNVNLVAHSLGGVIAQAFCLKYPAYFKKVVFISTAANIFIHPSLLNQITTGVWDQGFLEEGLSNQLSHDAKKLIIEDMKSLRIQTETENIFNLSSINFSNDLERIGHSALIISGDNDRIVSPRRTMALAKRMPLAQLAVIEGAEHYPHMECAHKVSALINDFFS